MSDFIFGDSEPEDAWDPEDPIEDLILNLDRRVNLLVANIDIYRYRAEPMEGLRKSSAHHPTLSEMLDTIERRMAVVTSLTSGALAVSDREEVRIVQIEEDIAFLRGRLHQGPHHG